MTFLRDYVRRDTCAEIKYAFHFPRHHAANLPQRPDPEHRAAPAGARLGERLRQLRVAAGLTQSDLAGERFSKEYVSQIERGKTRPTRETIEWLAARLGVDAGFLERGVSADERSRVEAMLARAEALSNAHQYDDAIEEFENSRTAVLATGAPELEVPLAVDRGLGPHGAAARSGRRCSCSSAAGRSPTAPASRTSTAPRCSSGSASAATSCRASRRRSGSSARRSRSPRRSGLPCDLLRSEILGWRSRCYRRQRDFEAAREDVERALELAEALDDHRTMANVYFQASLVAERMGHWVLARSYAERAKAYYEELNDERNVGRLLNNLGGLNFLLGKPDKAVEDLKSAYRVRSTGAATPRRRTSSRRSRTCT